MFFSVAQGVSLRAEQGGKVSKALRGSDDTDEGDDDPANGPSDGAGVDSSDDAGDGASGSAAVEESGMENVEPAPGEGVDAATQQAQEEAAVREAARPSLAPQPDAAVARKVQRDQREVRNQAIAEDAVAEALTSDSATETDAMAAAGLNLHEARLEADSREGVSKAVKAAAAAEVILEGDRMEKHVQRVARDIAVREAKAAAKAAASTATGRAFRAARRLTGAQAKQHCEKMSHVDSMPALCRDEAVRFLDQLKRTKLTAWEHEAQRVAESFAQHDAFNAAHNAAMAVGKKQIQSYADTLTSSMYERFWQEASAEWSAIEAQDAKALSAKKTAFFKARTAAMIKEVQKKTTRQVWKHPIKLALEKMTVVARVEAKRVANKVAAEAVAPRFAKAAKALLPLAVRSAHTKAVARWKPKWVPAASAVDGSE